MRTCSIIVSSVVALCGLAIAQESKEMKPKTEKSEAPAAKTPTSRPATAETATSALDFTMKDIDGKDVPLSRYRGKVLLIVNVASQCGLTPQYEQLQQLHEKYHEQGLAILAFPANNFRSQEPGTNAEIKEFCRTKFHVGFDLFAKISVLGDDKCELYKFLTSKEKSEKFAGDIEWNFAKFLVGRDGKLVARYAPKTKPDDAELVKTIESAIAVNTP